MTSGIKDRVYIVTGASAGFGLAIADGLLAREAKVALLARRVDKLEEAAAKLNAQYGLSSGESVLPIAADVADAEAVGAAFAQVREHFSRLDGLINNAGAARPNFIENFREQDIELQLDVNIKGLVLCTKAAIPLLADSDNPRIVNISSASAEHHDEMWGLSLYAASKAAVERWSRDLRREMQRHGIGITILRPGAAATEFASEFDFDNLGDILKEWKARQGEFQDWGMSASHVADSVAFCLGMDAGVSVDVLEIRPNQLNPKASL